MVAKAKATEAKWSLLEFIQKAIPAGAEHDRAERVAKDSKDNILYKGILVGKLITWTKGEISKGDACRIKPEDVKHLETVKAVNVWSDGTKHPLQGVQAALFELEAQGHIVTRPIHFSKASASGKSGSRLVYLAGDLEQGASKATDAFLAGLK